MERDGKGGSEAGLRLEYALRRYGGVLYTLLAAYGLAMLAAGIIVVQGLNSVARLTGSSGSPLLMGLAWAIAVIGLAAMVFGGIKAVGWFKKYGRKSPPG